MVEVNFDGLVGPTHHFGGLGVGNIASRQHARQPSSPQQAALQGLAKARLVEKWGVPQFLLLPLERPRLDLLQDFGFQGRLAEQLEGARESAPQLLSAVFSSGFMWAANAATVTPAIDALDGVLHLTPANLISSVHRTCEADGRGRQFEEIFRQIEHCRLHRPLLPALALRDEGAANHMRLAAGGQGVHVFVYGESWEGKRAEGEGADGDALRFQPRQSQMASEMIARTHHLQPTQTIFLQQHPAAISAGVFHNDVIATSHETLLLHHELAFLEAEAELSRLEQLFREVAGERLIRVEISDAEFPLADAVESYFFNSQIVTPGATRSGLRSDRPRMVIMCPVQCEEIRTARRLVQRLIADPDIPIDAVEYVDLQQSMANGGGPACLRLRVPLDGSDVERLPGHLRVSERLEERLRAAIERWYPQRLTLDDFCNLDLVEHLSAIPAELERALRSADV